MRYLIFSGDDYYPAGGFGDFDKGFDSEDEARTYMMKLKADWLQLVDLPAGTYQRFVWHRGQWLTEEAKGRAQAEERKAHPPTQFPFRPRNEPYCLNCTLDGRCTCGKFGAQTQA